MGAAVAGTTLEGPKSGDRNPWVTPGEALTAAYRASFRSGPPAIPSDRVLHHAMGRDQIVMADRAHWAVLERERWHGERT